MCVFTACSLFSHTRVNCIVPPEFSSSSYTCVLLFNPSKSGSRQTCHPHTICHDFFCKLKCLLCLCPLYSFIFLYFVNSWSPLIFQTFCAYLWIILRVDSLIAWEVKSLFVWITLLLVIFAPGHENYSPSLQFSFNISICYALLFHFLFFIKKIKPLLQASLPSFYTRRHDNILDFRLLKSHTYNNSEVMIWCDKYCISACIFLEWVINYFHSSIMIQISFILTVRKKAIYRKKYVMCCLHNPKTINNTKLFFFYPKTTTNLLKALTLISYCI